jgi:hypothetical protein
LSLLFEINLLDDLKIALNSLKLSTIS